MESIMTG